MTKSFRKYPEFEFHISNVSRLKYGIKDELLTTTGTLITSNKAEIQKLVLKVNETRDEYNKITSGGVNAAGLLDEVFHHVFRYYEKNVNGEIFQNTIDFLNRQLGETSLKNNIIDFLQKFPPKSVYKQEIKAADYLAEQTPDRPNLARSLEELVLLYFCNFNPANEKLKEFFNENLLANTDSYRWIIFQIDKFFAESEPIKNGKDIFTFLKEPIINHPDDIEAQLEFIINNWTDIIDRDIINEILKGKDLLKEEKTFGGFGGQAPTFVPDYSGESSINTSLGKSGFNYGKDSHKDYQEEEKFTQDIHWMPQVVLLAKNIYVWLDQVSKKYNKIIRRLDQIPDEELDELQNRNFTGLWLIGVWERSNASRVIKNKMGNPDAVASAYSLYDYEIAHSLGGEMAYENLNQRCMERGIRLASDMVPNHTGIYSKWMIEHPEYFVQSDTPPFPNYTFNSDNLSENPDIDVRIEDGYYNHSDAAVVFRRINNRTGETKYIYHGNDGTNMPWNDTAQLNYSIKEVREAVIQKIFDVARRFSIIRFDAAMTLAKKHYQRLWFPQPGTGGDIPSRSEYSMTKEEFDQVFPVEFWREVVYRINEELPETLLLAEAFWLMEGYFVRTLGMHRVYNSAFMNMIMREENFKYKDLIKKTLEFEPEILKRYVNFMSNPDEETAIKQFGTGDKYFGVCTLMLTLPGLPMFAHGQVEGYSEKYGMEYQRAYYNETPNQDLVQRHEREIFPLAQTRYLFSDVKNFWLYDFHENNNFINDNVFAYTNSFEEKRALVLFNNKYESTEGTINVSSKKLVKEGENKYQTEITIANALGIKDDVNIFYILHDHISGLEFIVNGQKIHQEGMHLKLRGFEYKVFTEIREVYDVFGDYEKFARHIGTEGVPSVEYSIEEMNLQQIVKSTYELINENNIRSFVKSFITDESNETETALTISNLNNFSRYLHFNIEQHFNFENNEKEILKANEKFYLAIKDVNRKFQDLSGNYRTFIKKGPGFKLGQDCNYHENAFDFLISRALYNIQVMTSASEELTEENYLYKLHLDNHIKNILSHTGKAEQGIHESLNLICLLVELQKMFEAFSDKELENCCKKKKNEKKCVWLSKTLLQILDLNATKAYLHLNTYNEIRYFSKENYEDLVDWVYTLLAVTFEEAGIKKKNMVLECQEVFKEVKGLGEKSGYDFDKLLENFE
ncbi:MAG: alpha-amylase family glycosyl hydrolase [Rhodothermaceae bacterium]